MPWTRHGRHMPGNWKTIRRRVLTRDNGTCQIAGPDCTIIATEVDHIGHRDNHHPTNLRAVCATCHQARTNAQSHDRIPRKRPDEPHPGY